MPRGVWDRSKSKEQRETEKGGKTPAKNGVKKMAKALPAAKVTKTKVPAAKKPAQRAARVEHNEVVMGHSPILETLYVLNQITRTDMAEQVKTEMAAWLEKLGDARRRILGPSRLETVKKELEEIKDTKATKTEKVALPTPPTNVVAMPTPPAPPAGYPVPPSPPAPPIS